MSEEMIPQAQVETPRQPPIFASRVAQRKWEELQAQGYRMQSLTFGGAYSSGTIDAWGAVEWNGAKEARTKILRCDGCGNTMAEHDINARCPISIEPDHEFKNFHRLLCKRFGYTHDSVDWKRDQLSLVEHIAKKASQPEPIDMLLHCPVCGTQHIDAEEAEDVFRATLFSAAGATENNPKPWSNPPHRSHLCHGCGHIWRPADVPTNGVAAIKTKGANDDPMAPPVIVFDAKKWAEFQKAMGSGVFSPYLMAAYEALFGAPDVEAV